MKKKIIIFAIIVVLVLIILKIFPVSTYLNEENLKKIIKDAGVWAPVTYILLYSFATVLFMPGIPFAIIAGALFGPFWGVVYADTGATIGACISFLLARYFLRDWVKEKIKGKRLENIDKEVGKNGWKVVAFTRLIPLFPFNLLNYFYGITGVKFFEYFFATLIFMLPGCIGYVVFGSSIFDLMKGKFTPEFYLGICLIIIVSIIPIVYRRLK